MRHDAAVASYLFAAAREPLLRLFYRRNNEPLEWSRIRIHLENEGVRADTPNHWGSLVALLHPEKVQERVLECVGREKAAIGSRNDAKNGAYKLSGFWWEYVQKTGAARGWPAAEQPVEPKVEQTALVS